MILFVWHIVRPTIIKRTRSTQIEICSLSSYRGSLWKVRPKHTLHQPKILSFPIGQSTLLFDNQKTYMHFRHTALISTIEQSGTIIGVTLWLWVRSYPSKQRQSRNFFEHFWAFECNRKLRLLHSTVQYYNFHSIHIIWLSRFHTIFSLATKWTAWMHPYFLIAIDVSAVFYNGFQCIDVIQYRQLYMCRYRGFYCTWDAVEVENGQVYTNSNILEPLGCQIQLKANVIVRAWNRTCLQNVLFLVSAYKWICHS